MIRSTKLADSGTRMAPFTAPPQGISMTLLFIFIGWVEEKLRAVWCAGHFVAVLEAVAAFVG